MQNYTGLGRTVDRMEAAATRATTAAPPVPTGNILSTADHLIDQAASMRSTLSMVLMGVLSLDSSPAQGMVSPTPGPLTSKLEELHAVLQDAKSMAERIASALGVV